MDTRDIDRYLHVGRKDRYWYQQCEKDLIEIFGQDQLQIVCKLLAATSINTSLKSNITLFRRAYYEYKEGLEFSSYLPVMRMQLERIRAGGELSGRKIRSFAAAMSGDTEAVVVDIWMLRAFKMNRKYVRNDRRESEGGASDKQYRIIENWCREEAKKYDFQPRELHAMIWSGIRTLEGGDPQTRYTDILRPQYIDSLFPYQK